MDPRRLAIQFDVVVMDEPLVVGGLAVACDESLLLRKAGNRLNGKRKDELQADAVVVQRS